MRSLIVGLALLFLCGNAVAQVDESVALRAVEDALQAKLSERPASLLRVAQAFEGTSEGDRALVVGLGYVACMLQSMNAVPEIRTGVQMLMDDEDDGDWEQQQVAALLPGFQEILTRRQAYLSPELRETTTELLNQRIRLSCPPIGTAYVRSASPLVVPPLAVDMSLRLWPFAHDRERTESLVEKAARHHELVLGGRRELESLPPGVWLAQLEERETGFAARRIIAVTDLQAECILGPDGAVVFVHRGGVAVAGATVGFGDQSEARTDERGIAALPADISRGSSLSIRIGDEEVVQQFRHYWRRAAKPRERAHIVVDAPLYRPGAKMRGRVVLRQLQQDRVMGALGLAVANFSGSGVSDARYQLRCEIPGCKAVTQDLAINERGVGPFEIDLPAGAESGDVGLEVLRLERWSDNDEPKLEMVAESTAAAIAHYRRAPMTLELDAPAAFPVGATDIEVVATATWVHGAPARGRSVRLETGGRMTRSHDPKHALATTDAAGRCTFKIAVPAGQRRRLYLRATSGECVTRKTVTDRVLDRLHWSAPTGEVPAAITVEGEVGQRYLVALFAEVPVWAATAVIDESGSATIAYPGVEGLEGEFELIASSGGEVQRRTVVWHAPGTLAHVEIETAPRADPGKSHTVKLSLRDRGAQPVQGSVAVAVVDERLFALREDRIEHPRKALRPFQARYPFVAWAGPHWTKPGSVLGALVVDGRIPPSWSVNMGGPASAGAGGAAAMTREDFRAAAWFCADLEVDGSKTIEVPLPDDLTTWRITCWAVDSGLGGVKAAARVATRLPLSAALALPRVLRVGDEVEVPVSVRSEQRAQVALSGSAKGDCVTAQFEQSAEVDEVLELAMAMKAQKAGTAKVAFDATSELGHDQLLREVPVLEATVDRTVHRGAVIHGTGKLEGVEGALQQQITLFDSDAAVLTTATQYLESYPYGCVEQTLSKITPYLVRQDLNDAERYRCDRGLARLGALLVDPKEGFAWWPGGEVDHAMTGLVLCALADLAAGIPQGAMPRLDLSRGSVSADAALLAGGAALGRDRIERVVGALAVDPDGAVLRDAVRRLPYRDQPLPAGMLLRAGRALARAGDRKAAKAALERYEAGKDLAPTASRAVRFPGESPLAVAAEAFALAVDLAAATERIEKVPVGRARTVRLGAWFDLRAQPRSRGAERRHRSQQGSPRAPRCDPNRRGHREHRVRRWQGSK